MATKAKIQQFIMEAKTAIASGDAFGLTAKQQVEALDEISRFTSTKFIEAQCHAMPPRRVR